MVAAVDSLPTISREQWPAHPHYPSQLLLLGSHENFRRTSDTLLRAVERGGDLAGVEWLYRRWTAAMRSHEAYEEHKLYPYLQQRWGVTFDLAKAGHERLHVLDTCVRETLQRDHNGHAQEVGSVLGEHQRVLLAHLEYEENLVIPLLLGLAPAEFQRFCNTSIEELLQP